MIFHHILAISIPRIAIALIVAVFFAWICICIAMQIIDGLKNLCFELTDEWKVDFSKKPIRFCLLIIMYSFFFVILLLMGWFGVSNLFTK